MSERTVYAIASGKGGVGKTTTAINLGAMLSERDHSVVVVDTDLGMANLADFLDFEIETPTLHEVLAGDADFEDAIYRAPGGIDVLPSATDIEAFTKSNPKNLEGVVAPLREEYDYVLLDTGAGVSYDTLVPLALADAVLLVATPDVASVRDTAKTGELAERVESEVAGAVLTQRSSDILNADDVEETLGTDVLAVVPQDEAVPMGIDAGRPLAAFAPNAPAGQAYRDLAAVLTGEADPDPELDLGDTDEDAEEVVAELGEDRPTGEEIAENVREAIESGDESEGLLGGELASAAEEIQNQTAGQTIDSSTELEADSPETAVEGTEDDERIGQGRADREETDHQGTDHQGTDATEETADEARSVDDLINEHISDDRLGGDDPFGGDGDDPLGGASDDDSDSGGESEDFLDAGDEDVALGDADDPLGDEEGFNDEDGLSDERGLDAGPGEASAPEGVAEANHGDEQSERGSEDSELGAVPFEEDRDDSAGSEGDSTGRSEPEKSESAKDESAKDEPANEESERNGSETDGRSRDETAGETVLAGEETDDEGDGDSGILGRLGSLLR